ncbi:hypothetical protein IscW_ISCW009612 [Ixodes scapularis]|uniref:Peptidase M13 N-terminal domain-containing protein n=1 Tax=Ixodes scapularis TaxID=6945 RepID=B7Q3Q1_IXOSC|nr:hypothetical protein IscW_ISCW009612 [Ixodes scapularis]|eukprot:XP_002411349.1 hypothetical protein IscW_ISCW009612 [Ixodes scapularis]
MMFAFAARYQDGVLFWIEVSPSHLDPPKRLLQLRANPHFLRWIEASPSDRKEFTRRKMALTLKRLGVRDWTQVERLVDAISLAEEAVHSLWNETVGEHAPQHLLTTFKELETDGIPAAILRRELLSLGVFRSPLDWIEVMNKNVLTFLKRLLHVKSLRTYVVWELAMHFTSCGPNSRLRHRVYNLSRDHDSFRCTEDVTGLAAHAASLYAALDQGAERQLTLLVHDIRNAIMRSINSASWLTAGDRDRMIKTLIHVRISHGFPARFQSLESLNSYYSYLPNLTGNLWRDYYNAASASWLKSLDGTAAAFPLLSAGTNVLTGKGFIFIPAEIVWQQLLVNRASFRFGSLGFAAATFIAASTRFGNAREAMCARGMC